MLSLGGTFANRAAAHEQSSKLKFLRLIRVFFIFKGSKSVANDIFSSMLAKIYGLQNIGEITSTANDTKSTAELSLCRSLNSKFCLTAFLY